MIPLPLLTVVAPLLLTNRFKAMCLMPTVVLEVEIWTISLISLAVTISNNRKRTYGLDLLIPALRQLLEVSESKTCQAFSKTDLRIFKSFIKDVYNMIDRYDRIRLSSKDKKLIKEALSLVEKLQKLSIYKI